MNDSLERRWRVSAPVLVALAGCAIHGRSLSFGFTSLDDVDLIVDDQPFLALPSSLWRVFTRAYFQVVDGDHAYYRPLVTASYALDAQWSGLRPFGYHLTNVLLHGVASLLFFVLLRRFDLGRGVSLAAALLFAVHPALAPAVDWIPGRNDSLLAVFVLGSWLFFLREWARPSWQNLTAHWLLFALALLTKEAAGVLPLVCALHVALLEPQSRGGPGLGRVATGWVAVMAMRIGLHPSAPAATAREVLSNLEILPKGFGTLTIPWNVSVLGESEDRPLWPGLFALSALAAASFLVPGVRRRVVAMGAGAFVLFTTPALAVSGSLTLDHRLYVPACGAILAWGEIVRALLLEPRVLGAFAGAGLAALSAMTLAYEGVFRDRLAFARDAVASSPHSSLAHFCMGQVYQLAKQDNCALAEYHMALALGPVENAHNNIAVIHMANSRWGDAENELRQELATNPHDGRAYHNLGVVLRRKGRFDEACDAEERALRWEPTSPSAKLERDMACAEVPR